MPELRDDFRRHALAYMRFGMLVVQHEYMRLVHLLLLTDDPTNRRALQFSQSAASLGSGISERFITTRASVAYAKAGLSNQSQPFKKDTESQNPAAGRDNKNILAAASCFYPSGFDSSALPVCCYGK